MKDTTTRDTLARDRTALANERTLLAYGRTALAAAALSLFVFKFAPTVIGIPIGISSFIVAIAIIFIGIRNYRAVSSRITDR